MKNCFGGPGRSIWLYICGEKSDKKVREILDRFIFLNEIF